MLTKLDLWSDPAKEALVWNLSSEKLPKNAKDLTVKHMGRGRNVCRMPPHTHCGVNRVFLHPPILYTSQSPTHVRTSLIHKEEAIIYFSLLPAAVYSLLSSATDMQENL